MKITKTKQEKGITLIALIITIVVLLILAVVAINSIQNDGIISKADQAANRYNESVSNEQTILGGYLDYLDRYDGVLTDMEVLKELKEYFVGKNMENILFIDDENTQIDESAITIESAGINEDETKRVSLCKV